MTKYLLFSDIQGDLKALQRFERASRNIPRDQVVCLGDLIGKGKTSEENQILEILRNFGNISFVSGNHEDNYLNGVKLTNGDRLSKQNRDFVEQLPLTLTHGKILAYHSSLTHPDEILLQGFLDWEYAAAKRAYSGAEFVLFGHSHVPQILSYNPRTEKTENVAESGTIDLEDDFYFINPGSIAEPGIMCGSRKTFATLDDKTRQVRFYELN